MVVTSERFKAGPNSLRWTWKAADSSLACVRPGDFAKITDRQSLAFWAYSEKPMEKILRMELLKDGNVVGKCWCCLNFKGWRPLGAPYAQVLAEPEKTAVDGFRLIAPKNVVQGRLYLDCVNPRCPDRLWASSQQPWVGKPEMLKTFLAGKLLLFESRHFA